MARAQKAEEISGGVRGGSASKGGSSVPESDLSSVVA